MAAWGCLFFCGRAVGAVQAGIGLTTAAPELRFLERTNPQFAKTFPKAIEALDQALDATQKGDYQTALDLLSAAEQKHPQLPPARLMLARFLLANRNSRLARPLLEQIARERPGYPGVYLAFGSLALQEGHLTDALLHFDRSAVLAADWDGPQRSGFQFHAYAGLATIYQTRGDWASAKAQLTAWLELEPNNGRARQQLARVLFGLDQVSEAQKELEQAVKDDPTLEAVPVSLGWMYSQRGDQAQAARWFEQAVAAQPDDAQVRLAMATWLVQQGKGEAAQEHLDRAQQVAPDLVPAKLLRASLLRNAGDLKGAEQILEPLNRESPENLQAGNLLALVLADQDDAGKRDRALTLATANVQRFPSETLTLATLCWVHFRRGELAEAERAIVQAATLGGRFTTEQAYYFASVLAKRGRTKEAIKLLEPVLKSPGGFLYREQATELMNELKTSPP
jgi:uncharacterized protein (TIGR02996 family)